jgi:hypothetical protein
VKSKQAILEKVVLPNLSRVSLIFDDKLDATVLADALANSLVQAVAMTSDYAEEVNKRVEEIHAMEDKKRGVVDDDI